MNPYGFNPSNLRHQVPFWVPVNAPYPQYFPYQPSIRSDPQLPSTNTLIDQNPQNKMKSDMIKMEEYLPGKAFALCKKPVQPPEPVLIMNNSPDNSRRLLSAECKAASKETKLSTEFHAAYYDPSYAPMISSDYYCGVENTAKEAKRRQKMIDNPVNELDNAEEDSNPFIVFKYRRIKKKYQQYLKTDQRYRRLSVYSASNQAQYQELDSKLMARQNRNFRNQIKNSHKTDFRMSSRGKTQESEYSQKGQLQVARRMIETVVSIKICECRILE